jgi:NADH-quinone oxidoreductase subunit L
MAILSLLSLVGGFVGLPGHDALGTLLSPVIGAPKGLAAGSASFWLSLALSLVCALAGIGVAWALYGARAHQFVPRRGVIYQFVAHKWYFDVLDDWVFVRPVLWLGRATTRAVEGVTLDGGGRAVGWTTGRLSAGLRALQTGYVRNYALAILLGAVVMLLYYLIRLGLGG